MPSVPRVDRSIVKLGHFARYRTTLAGNHY